MNKLIFNRAMTIIIASFVCICSSCVNEEYELSKENLDLTATLFQDGVSIPLGSTSKITLGSLASMLDEDTKKYIQQLEDAYMFGVSDSFDMTKDIQDAFSGIGGLESLTMNEEFSFRLSNIDLSSISIEGQTLGTEGVNISDMMKIPDINECLPTISESLSGFSINLPSLNADDLTLDISSVIGNFTHNADVVSLGKLNVPSQIKSSPLYTQDMYYNDLKDNDVLKNSGLLLPDLTSCKFEEYSVEVPLRITLPKEIQSVKSIKLDKDASFELIIEMQNTLFTSGSFAPEILINLHDLFHIDKDDSGLGEGGYVDHPDGMSAIEHHIHDKFVMNAKNGWKADHVYHIDSLAVSADDWKKVGGALVLDKKVAITLSGELKTDGLKTTLEQLDEKGKDPMSLKIDIKFNDLEIDDVEMYINPVSVSQNLGMSFDIQDIHLPEIVKKVDYVEFDQGSPLRLTMSADVPEYCDRMNLSLKTLKIEFPEGVEVAHDKSKGDAGDYDPTTRTLVYSGVKLAEGLQEDIMIKRLHFDEPVAGKLSYLGDIQVVAEAYAQGVVSSKSILNSNDDESLSVDVNVLYEPKLSDYCVLIDDYLYDIQVNPVVIETEVSSDVAQMFKGEPVTVTVKQIDGENPKIVINLDYPSDVPALQIRPKKGEGLKLDFPDIINFSAASVAKYKIDTDTNSIFFDEDDVIPNEIELEISGITVLPEKVGNKYFIKDRLEVFGGVRLAATEFHMSDVAQIQNSHAKIGFSAKTPTLSPAEIGLDEYVISISERIDIDGMEIDIPEVISTIRVSEITLKDVYLALDIDASEVASLVGGAKMTLSMDISLPEILMVEGVQDGKLHIEKEFKNGILNLEPIRINGLDLSKIGVKDGKLSLEKMAVAIDGSLKAEELKIDMDQLEGKDVAVAIAGGLASYDAAGKPTETIEIDKIVGNVGLGIEPIETTLDLSSVAEAIRGENLSVVPDIDTFWLTLDVNTNIDIPVKADLEIVPYFGEEAGEKTVVEISLDPEKRVNDQYRIYISNKNPQTPGLTFINLDLVSLLYKKVSGQKTVMASNLVVNMNAGLDPEKECVIEPSKDYVFSVDYQVGIPLALGKDFIVEYRDVIDDIPAEANQLLAYGSLGLGGKITNGLPLHISLQLILLDAEGNVIPMKQGAGKMEIAPCDPTGRPVATDISLVLGGIDKNAPELNAIEFVFTVDSKGAVGVPLSSDSFLQVQLSALIPDGVTLDLNSMLEGEKNEDGEDNE